VLPDYQLRLRKLQRRDWWLWVTTALVMLLLTLAVVSFTVPALFRDQTAFFQFNLEQAVRGLVAVVLLFNLYAIYQQWVMKRLHRQLAQQIEATARLETRAELLQKLAMLDPLTGLHNRREAEARLAAEVSRSHRYGHRLAVVILDLNDFKRINDVYGHAAGDLVLKAFADRLKQVIRTSDVAVRMGGDEFLLLLPECPESHAPQLLERIGPVTVELRGEKLTVSYSAGWAGYRLGETPAEFLERADQMLYHRKRQARPAEASIAAS
jgi:diguanylate cyclase (GGDEF)-like protein